MPLLRPSPAGKILILTLALFFVSFPLIAQTKSSIRKLSPAPDQVRDVDFCEIVRHPRRFFKQTVRIRAKWESGKAFSYLTEDRCPVKSGNEIAVAVNDVQDGSTVTNLKKIRSREYGDQAIITAVGTLLDRGKYPRGPYRYHFYIFRLEEVGH